MLRILLGIFTYCFVFEIYAAYINFRYPIKKEVGERQKFYVMLSNFT